MTNHSPPNSRRAQMHEYAPGAKDAPPHHATLKQLTPRPPQLLTAASSPHPHHAGSSGGGGGSRAQQGPSPLLPPVTATSAAGVPALSFLPSLVPPSAHTIKALSAAVGRASLPTVEAMRLAREETPTPRNASATSTASVPLSSLGATAASPCLAVVILVLETGRGVTFWR